MVCQGRFKGKVVALGALPLIVVVGFILLGLGRIMNRQFVGTEERAPQQMIHRELQSKFGNALEQVIDLQQKLLTWSQLQALIHEISAKGDNTLRLWSVLDNSKLVESIHITIQTSSHTKVISLPQTAKKMKINANNNEGWEVELNQECIMISNTKTNIRAYQSNLTLIVTAVLTKDIIHTRLTLSRLGRGLNITAGKTTLQYISQLGKNPSKQISFNLSIEQNSIPILTLTILDSLPDDPLYNIPPIELISFIFLLAIISTYSRVSTWCRKYFAIVSNVESILRTTLQDSFSKKTIRKEHTVISESADLQKLCEKYLELTVGLAKPTLTKVAKIEREPFKFQQRLKVIVGQFQQTCRPKASEICREVLNSKHLLHEVNSFMEQQQSEFNMLLRQNAQSLQRLYYCAYMSLITKDTEYFSNIVIANAPTCESPSLLSNDYDLEFFEEVNYNLRSANIDELIKEKPFSVVAQKLKEEMLVPAVKRIQSLLLSKYLFMVKDSDVGRRHLVSLGLVQRLEEIQQEIDNARYELSQHNKKFRGSSE